MKVHPIESDGDCAVTTTTLIGGIAGRRLLSRFRSARIQVGSIRATPVAEREAAPSRCPHTAAFMGSVAADEAALAALVLSR